MKSIICIIALQITLFSQSPAPIQTYFMQGNNINTVFSTDGIFNYDKISFPSMDAGFVWPVSSSTRMTADFATGIWIGAKVGIQRELRLAASIYSSHFTPGNIPVLGQITPQSVCSDPTWKGYLVQLTDQSLVNGGTRIKTAGGTQYTFVYESWASWPVAKGAPYAEVNGIPGYQPGWTGDRPGIGNGSLARPDDLLFMVYQDYTNCTNQMHLAEISLPGGTLPLGVEIHQLSFMFNCPGLQDMYFMKFKIINRSSLVWDSTFITIANDIDIGNLQCGAADDAAGCDSTRNLAFIYNGDNLDCNYGGNPPVLGTRMLQSPIKFTGNNNDTAKLPYDTLIGYKLLGMTSFIRFTNANLDPCFNDPDEAVAGYNFMRGLDGCGRTIINQVTGQPTTYFYPGNACTLNGWIDSSINDNRYTQSSGPITMNSNDTQIMVISFAVTRAGGNSNQNVCNLISMSDSALKYYYTDFQSCSTIGIQPISNEVPERFALYQNYPNPFNPATKIKFEIPLLRGVDGAKGDRRGVLLQVYDILGREITTLVNEELKPGTYEVDWQAENYPSGVYFYTLRAGSINETKKMVLLK